MISKNKKNRRKKQYSQIGASNNSRKIMQKMLNNNINRIRKNKKLNNNIKSIKNKISIKDWLVGKNIPTLSKGNSNKLIYRTSVLKRNWDGRLSRIEQEITFGNGNENDVITKKLSGRTAKPDAFRYIDKEKNIDRFTPLEI